MHKLSLLKILVTAALIGITTGNTRAEETMPAMPATAAVPGYGPGWYSRGPDRRGYGQPWTQPRQRPAPAPGYGPLPPYYPPYGQYRADHGAVTENPLDTELRQTQDQLATQTSELEATRKQLARLQNKLEAATVALQKAQSDTINAGRQVDTTRAEVDTLRYTLCELAARIEGRNIALQNALKAAAAEPDGPDSDVAGETDTETSEQAEPPIDPQCSQLTSTPAITSGQRGITVKAQAR